MTMQAIQTRYFGPTDTRGSRIKAFSEAFPRGVYRTPCFRCAESRDLLIVRMEGGES